MRNDSTHCHGKRERLKFKHAPFDRDERAVSVEHILNILNESRFGPDRSQTVINDLPDLPCTWLNYKPTPDDDALHHLMPVGPLHSVGTETFKKGAANSVELSSERRLNKMSASATVASATDRSPSRPARGSPSSKLTLHSQTM